MVLLMSVIIPKDSDWSNLSNKAETSTTSKAAFRQSETRAVHVSVDARARTPSFRFLGLSPVSG